MHEDAVPNHPPVHKKIEGLTIGLLHFRLGDEGVKPDFFSRRRTLGRTGIRQKRQLRLQLHQLLEQIRSEYLEQPLAQPIDSLKVEYPGARTGQGKAAFRMRQGVLGHHVDDVAQLGAVTPQEFLSSRQVEEQIPHGHRGPDGTGNLSHAHDPGPGDFHRRSDPLTLRLRLHQEPGDPGHTGERLASETKGPDLAEIFGPVDLAGGVPLEGQQGIVGGHALPVIQHPHQTLSACLNGDFQVAGSGIQGVLQQLLHHRGRAFHHLACGNLVGQRLRQKTYS